MNSTDLVKTLEPAMVAAAILDGAELPEIATSEDTTRELLSSILNAETADAVLAVFDSNPWRALLDEPVVVHGVKWRPSAFSEGSPVFAIVDLQVVESGELTTVTVGGRSVMAALYRMDQLQAWPQTVKLTETKKANADGNKALQLARA